MNFGTVSLAAPHAASSRVSRYSRTDRRVLAMASQSTSSDPAAERCLLASAAMRRIVFSLVFSRRLSLSQTKSSWRAETNRLMLPSDDRSLQADFLDTRRPNASASNTGGRDLGA